MEITEVDISNYPFLRFGKRGAEVDEGRHSIIDVRTGDEIAWWTENFGNCSKQNKSKELKMTLNDDGLFDPSSIFISGLDVRTSKEEIFYHFSSVGEISRVTKLKSKSSGKFSGSAYVEYTNAAVAENALFLNRSFIRGCSIMVQRKYKKTHTDDSIEPQSNIEMKIKEETDDLNANGLSAVKVSNIESSFTQLDVAAHFQQSGDIKKVTMSVDSDDLGVAIIHFKNQTAVDNALTLNNTWLGENVILVEKFTEAAEGKLISLESEPNNNQVMNSDFDLCSVFVGNLGPNIFEADLSCLFSSVGNVERVTILKSKVTKHYLPSAYIQFTSQDEASKALQFDGTNLHGNYLAVQRKRKTVPRKRS